MTTAKAWIGAIIGFIGAFLSAWAATGDLTWDGFIAALAAFVATGGLVYLVPNKPKSPEV